MMAQIGKMAALGQCFIEQRFHISGRSKVFFCMPRFSESCGHIQYLLGKGYCISH